MQQVIRRYRGFFLFFFTLLATTPLLAAAPATVEFVSGLAHIRASSGEKRDIKKGSEVQVGETVLSESGRVQLRFSDGGFVSLVPHSEFRVNAYSYKESDGLERIAMELLKGGLRTITGLIGKRNKSAYEMKTAVATIGIRGTEYTVVYGESVSGTVSAGAIAVCNSGGCLEVPIGQSYYVKDENTKPVFISEAAVLPPPQPVLAEEAQEGGETGFMVEGPVAEAETTNATSSRNAVVRSRGSDSAFNPPKHLKHDHAHPLKGKHGDDRLSVAKHEGKGLDKVGKGQNGFKSLSAADPGNSQLTVMPTPGKSSNSSLIVFQTDVSPGLGNSGNHGHGKGHGNLLGGINALTVTGDDILGGPLGKDKKPKL